MQHILYRARRQKRSGAKGIQVRIHNGINTRQQGHTGVRSNTRTDHCKRQEGSGTLFITENKIKKNRPAQQGAVTNMEIKGRHTASDIQIESKVPDVEEIEAVSRNCMAYARKRYKSTKQETDAILDIILRYVNNIRTFYEISIYIDKRIYLTHEGKYPYLILP